MNKFIKEKRKIDYDLKAQVIKKGLHILENDVSTSKYADFLKNICGNSISHKHSIEEAISIDNFMTLNNSKEWKEAKNINRAYRSRLLRAKNKINTMLKSGTCLLLTFTFTDKCLAKTTFETRKQKVRRFLSAHNCNYIANVDYGKQHNREHFHSIAQIDKVDFSLFNKYGALNGKVITKKNAKQLAKYIVKGTNKNIAINKKLMHLMYNRPLS